MLHILAIVYKVFDINIFHQLCLSGIFLVFVGLLAASKRVTDIGGDIGLKWVDKE